MEYIISREKFLKLKEYQKSLVGLRREVKKAFDAYSVEMQKWWQERPEYHWGKAEDDWWKRNPKKPYPINPTKEYARAFNILYGLLKGKTYEQIEKKTKGVDKPSSITNSVNVCFVSIIRDFNLDKEAMKPILALVPFAWK